MRLIAIANIVNKSNKTIGFRLLDIDYKQVKDVSLESVGQALQSGKVTINNLEIENGVIMGTNGSIDRLPKIINGQLVRKSPLIILHQLGDTGYTVSDFKGIISNIKTEAIIKYAKANGIANGKLVSKDNKVFVSSINGTYDLKELNNKDIEINTIEKVNAKLGMLNMPYRVTNDGGIRLVNNNISELTIHEPVRYIPVETFSENNYIRTINIQSAITKIEDRAFMHCEYLVDIKIPNSVVAIGKRAFGYCNKLTKIILPNNIKSIGNFAFGNCKLLNRIDIPENIKVIDEGVFVFCTALKQVKLPNSITTISENAFAHCYELESINLPDSITRIDDNAFAHCYKLEFDDKTKERIKKLLD